MIIKLIEITRPGKKPATKSLGMDTVWNCPNFATASGGGIILMPEIPKITIGIEGGITTPRPPEDAVIAEA